MDVPSSGFGLGFIPDARPDRAASPYVRNDGNVSTRVTASFTRPADTTPYALGDGVANSVTAGSVVPMQFQIARAKGGGGQIVGAKLRKSGTATSGAAFRLHLFRSLPTVSSGDNAALAMAGADGYLGYCDIAADVALTDGAVGVGGFANRPVMVFDTAAGSMVVFGLLEARGAYTPASGEVVAVTLEVVAD